MHMSSCFITIIMAAYDIVDEDNECDIIGTILMENDIEVDDDDPKYLKYFTVKGEALFECDECESRWSSHNTTVKVDLLRQEVSKKYTQKCKSCDYWATPLFTRDRFERIMNKVVEKYEKRVDKNGQLFTIDNDDDDDDDDDNDDDDEFTGHTQAPHMEEYCERCKELGGPCWNTVQKNYFI